MTSLANYSIYSGPADAFGWSPENPLVKRGNNARRARRRLSRSLAEVNDRLAGAPATLADIWPTKAGRTPSTAQQDTP